MEGIGSKYDAFRAFTSVCFSACGIFSLIAGSRFNKLINQRPCDQMSVKQLNSLLSFPDTCWRGFIYGKTCTSYLLGDKFKLNSSSDPVFEVIIPSLDLIDVNGGDEKVTILIGKAGVNFLEDISFKHHTSRSGIEQIMYSVSADEEIWIYGDACVSHDGKIIVTPLSEFQKKATSVKIYDFTMLAAAAFFFLGSWLTKPPSIKEKTFIIGNQVIKIKKQTIHSKIDEYTVSAEKKNYDAEQVQIFTRKYISEECNPISVCETKDTIEAVYFVPIEKKVAFWRTYKVGQIFKGFVIGAVVWCLIDGILELDMELSNL